MERRLAAILAADVQGYSRLTELNEEASTATLRMYRAVVEESISAHRGRIFSSAGDGVVAEFPSIVEAIRCGVEIQNEIAERNEAVPEDGRMQFRIGVNLGDVIAEDNNLYGTGVNVAVRLEQLAEPGGICLSQTVYDQVRKIVKIPFEDIGQHRLKNIAEPVHVYRILPGPLPWLKRLFSRTNIHRQRFGVAAGVLLLLLALGAGAFYLRQPAALWATLLSDAGGLSLPDHPAIAVLPFDDIESHSRPAIPCRWNYRGADHGVGQVSRADRHGSQIYLGIQGQAYGGATGGKGSQCSLRRRGSIQRADQNVRVTAKLIDASTGGQIWANRYDREISTIFAIRDDITRSIGGTLGGRAGKLGKAEAARVSGKNPNSFTAYDYVTKGWYAYNKFTREDNAAARDLFELARKIDPNYARAYAGLAWTYELDYDYEWTDDDEKTLKLALEMATTAVRLDPDDSQAQWALGWAYLYNRQHERAMAHYLRSLELNPNDAEVLASMGSLHIYIGQPKQAVDQERGQFGSIRTTMNGMFIMWDGPMRKLVCLRRP